MKRVQKKNKAKNFNEKEENRGAVGRTYGPLPSRESGKSKKKTQSQIKPTDPG